MPKVRANLKRKTARFLTVDIDRLRQQQEGPPLSFPVPPYLVLTPYS
jgi:hypothetical protein